MENSSERFFNVSIRPALSLSFAVFGREAHRRLRTGSDHVHSHILCVGLVEDRTKLASNVVQEISSYVGGQQTFLGPTLAIPYTIPAQIVTGVRRSTEPI